MNSWHNAANVLYVDQPVGTGLSFTTDSNYANNDLQVCGCEAASTISVIVQVNFWDTKHYFLQGATLVLR